MAFEASVGALEERDRAFLRELLWGVLRMRGRLDHLLGLRVHRGLDSLDPVVLDILRLAAYEVLYMDGVPDYAAISQAVSLARVRAGKGAAGLVNAVLRALARSGVSPDLFPAPVEDPAGFLSTWGSHPRWLVERWLGRWPAADVRRLVEADNARAPVYLVPLDHSPEEAVALLEGSGVPASVVGQGTPCVELGPGGSPATALRTLPAVVQDPGAALVVRYADVPAGTKVADLCAAPGGKALAASRRAAYTVAADRSERRLARVKENLARAGGSVGVVAADARRPPLRGVDVVLLDVPCTGTGTLRRHPDARWRLRPEQVARLARLQEEMLEAAAELVPPGGLVVYSTCTLEPEENEEQVKRFLDRHGEFQLAPTDAVAEEFRSPEGFLRVLPHRSGFDGAFAARLERRA